MLFLKSNDCIVSVIRCCVKHAVGTFGVMRFFLLTFAVYLSAFQVNIHIGREKIISSIESVEKSELDLKIHFRLRGTKGKCGQHKRII